MSRLSNRRTSSATLQGRKSIGKLASQLTRLHMCGTGERTSRQLSIGCSRPTRSLKSAKLIDGFLERQTDLGSLGHHSQTDLLVIAGLNQGLAVLAIEGKAGEPFGEYVHEWLGRN